MDVEESQRSLPLEEEEDVFAGLAAMPIEPPEKRDTCSRCGRPVSVGLCKYFPKERIPVSSCVYIVQHPNEEKRVLRTVPILTACLPQGQCHIIRGKRFSEKNHPHLAKVCSSPNTLILFPGPDAIDVGDVPVPPPTTNGHTPQAQGYNIIIMDGTWHQASSIFKSNQMFRNPQQVQFSDPGFSEYTIRTQPSNSSVSTVESAAIALSVLERNPEIKEILAAPLRALCQYQLNHGAVVHHSKEYLKESLSILATLLRALCQYQLNHGAVVHHSKEYLKESFSILAAPLRALCQYQLNHGAVVHHSKEYLKENPDLPQYKSWRPRGKEKAEES